MQKTFGFLLLPALTKVKDRIPERVLGTTLPHQRNGDEP